LQILFPENKVSSYRRPNANCIDISVHNNMLPSLFPQHGIGKKHARKIHLAGWQENLVIQNPQLILSGLVESDGCIYFADQKGKEYLRYGFANKSKDIVDIFMWAAELIGVKPTICFNKKDEIYRVTISKKQDIYIMLNIIKSKS